MRRSEIRYPPIADYGVISNCHCCALISRDGSVDWCCMPRIDDDSCFGRLLDWDKGGFCRIAPAAEHYHSSRRYLPGTMILETEFQTESGALRLTDFFAMETEDAEHPPHAHVRIVEGISGELECRVDICPRFDYGAIIPHMQRAADGLYTAIGSNKGLIIHSDIPLEVSEHRDLSATFRIGAGDRVRVVLQFQRPELIERSLPTALRDADAIDRYFDIARAWWESWANRIEPPHDLDPQTLRSAIVLKSLTCDSTGAIAAASTTSLPEWIGGERNWDYRFSWIRDSAFIVHALHELGYAAEADRFQRFIQRSCAGSAGQLQVMYGVDGKRRLSEIELEWLEGYRGSRPVRIGNHAAKQQQTDIFGELLEIAWEGHARGRDIEPNYWAFLVDAADTVCACWQAPDHGIWELRGEARHHVHSKAMCWSALNRAIDLATEGHHPAPLDRWRKACDEIRAAVESEGYDASRGVFVQAFGNRYLDASLLLLPRVGFVAYDDPRMLRTTDAICRELDSGGLLRRYTAPDNLPGEEGMFVACTFWLVACLARQRRGEEAWAYYRRALACANDIGLFSEEWDAKSGNMLGNLPQGLTHVSQITARLALIEMD